MNVRDLENMPLEGLWKLHERIVAMLDRKLVQEKRKLEEKLNGLERKFGRAPADFPQRRPYPEVEQKYCNPANPEQTWSGKGKRPRWVIEFLSSGRSWEDCRISAAP